MRRHSIQLVLGQGAKLGMEVVGLVSASREWAAGMQAQ